MDAAARRREFRRTGGMAERRAGRQVPWVCRGAVRQAPAAAGEAPGAGRRAPVDCVGRAGWRVWGRVRESARGRLLRRA